LTLGGFALDREKLQDLAKARFKDAKVLLGRKRWSGAYYLSGYVVECGLKACLLRCLGESAAVFSDENKNRKLSDYWTHNLVDLVKMAGLEQEFGKARGEDPTLDGFWVVTQTWRETSRYEEKSEAEAKALFEAVSNETHGVFRWIRDHW
jgi:HEPN domain-containing protein